MTNPTKPAQTKVLSAEEQRACWTAILTNGEIRNDSPLLPNEHTAAADAITLLQNHIDVLTEQVRVLAEALEFYASPDNEPEHLNPDDNPDSLWNSKGQLVYKHDTPDSLAGSWNWKKDTGQRARSALAALEGSGE